jgi:D-beta-D-heptose 7-phosphate kinase/D-beta-D-heptose 1-phosphate adenosyltransferase
MMDEKQTGKVMDLAAMQAKLEEWRTAGQKIVFTNGCFDILHVGHVTLLAQAKALGDKLILGLNSDNSVKRLKGEQRPVNKESDRAIVLSALASVDAVILFSEDTPQELLQALRPDVLVKGGDYTKEQIVGADYIEQQGGQVVIVPFIKGYSTTETLAKIHAL